MEDLCLLCRQQLCTSLTCYWAWGLPNVLVWSCQCQLRPSNRSQGFGNHKITWMGCLRTCWCLGRSRVLCSLQPSPTAGLTLSRWHLLSVPKLVPDISPKVDEWNGAWKTEKIFLSSKTLQHAWEVYLLPCPTDTFDTFYSVNNIMSKTWKNSWMNN